MSGSRITSLGQGMENFSTSAGGRVFGQTAMWEPRGFASREHCGAFLHALAHPVRCLESVTIPSCVRGHHSARGSGELGCIGASPQIPDALGPRARPPTSLSLRCSVCKMGTRTSAFPSQQSYSIISKRAQKHLGKKKIQP